jgi:hypothetical protein
MIRNNPIYDNIPGVREERKRMEAQQALRTGAYPSGDPFDQSVKRGLMGEAGMDESAIRSAGILSPEREAMSNASRYAANYQALADAGVPGLSQGMPSGGSSGGRMAPKKPDPFAPGAGYQATDPSDPYYSKRPRKPMRLAEGGLFSMPMPGYAMGGPVMRNPYDRGMPPTVDEFSEAMGGKPFAMSHSGDPRTGPFREYYKRMSPKDRMVGGAGVNPFPNNKLQGYAEGGPVEGPGGPKDDLINAKLSDGEFVMPSEVVEFYGLDRLHKMMAKAKDGLNEIKPAPQALPTPLPVTMPQPTPAFAYGGMAQSMPVPGYAEGGPVLANNPEEEEFGLRRLAPNPYSVGPGYSITPMDPFAPAPPVSPSPSPQVPFVADPEAELDMRTNRFLARSNERDQAARLQPQPAMPAMANGRQPQPVLSSPMDVPLMRPAPLTMTEKEQQAKPISRSRTPESNPEFEAALAGLTGMQKRRARAGLQMEEATFQRNQGRAAIEQAQADERASQERALNFEEWKQKRVIDSQFDMAARNQAIGENAALGAATTREAREYEEAQNRRKQEEQSKKAKNFTPIPDTDYLINDLGNLISKKTNKPVGLSPEEAQKYGLVIIGADSDGRVRYGPPKVVEPTEDYIDPVSGDVLKLKPGQVLPEGTPYKPLTPETGSNKSATASKSRFLKGLNK